MTTAILGVVAILQLVFLVLLLGGLVTQRFVIERRNTRLLADRQELVAALHRHLRVGRSEDARALLDGCSVSVMSSVLQSLAVQLGGEDWERIATLVHESVRYPEILRRAASRLWWRRLEATRLLALVATEADADLVRDLVNDDHPAVRTAAAAALDRLESAELMEAVFDRAVGAGGVLASYYLDLLCTNRSSLLGVLMRRLSEPGSRLELATALNLAGRLAVPSLLDQVARYADHPDLEVRIATVRALGAFPHPRASRALRLRLRDPRWQVRAQAAAALGAICATEAAGELALALGDSSWWVRLRSGLALRQLGAAGLARLEAAEPQQDAFAHDMARYVLGLSDSAMAGYSGTGLVNYADAGSSTMVA